jgi:hypothetical protein
MFVTPLASKNVPAAWPGLAKTRPQFFSCMKAYPQATPEIIRSLHVKHRKFRLMIMQRHNRQALRCKKCKGGLIVGEILTCQGIEADASRYMLG